ncbi:MAG: TonB-dependent receptor [Bacteroidales bacterium]
MTKLLHIFILVLFAIPLFSQTTVDTLLTLEGIEVSSAKIMENTTGQKVMPIDTVLLKTHESSNLAEILGKGSGVQIKSYNSGGLSSISFRGTSAQHTGIFWHGFNLNQMNTGMIDLSLIPVSGFDRVEVIPGGGASLFGSGNIGGGIHLISKPEFDVENAAGINVGAGSFDAYNASIYNMYSDDKWYSKTVLNYARARNDFEYNNYLGQTGKLENNAFLRYGIMQDVYRKFQRSVLGVSLWYSTMDREIPPSVIEVPKDIDQYDRSFRSMISYRFELGKQGTQLDIKSGYFDEEFRYDENNAAGKPVIETRINTRKSQTEASLRLVRKNQIIKTGLIGIGEFGESESWNGDVSRLRGGAYLLYTLQIPSIRWKVSVNLRQEVAEGYAIPFTPSIGAEGAIFRWMSGKVNFSRNFRIPAFNELFWVPGGNPELKPEDSWNGESSLIVSPLLNSGSFYLKINGTAFSSWVDNFDPFGCRFHPGSPVQYSNGVGTRD